MKTAVVLTALAASLVALPAAASVELATKSKCMACHQVDKKALGPSFKDIGAKYKGDKKQFIEDVRQALYASKLCSYAQGYVQLDAAAGAISNAPCAPEASGAEQRSHRLSRGAGGIVGNADAGIEQPAMDQHREADEAYDTEHAPDHDRLQR